MFENDEIDDNNQLNDNANDEAVQDTSSSLKDDLTNAFKAAKDRDEGKYRKDKDDVQPPKEPSLKKQEKQPEKADKQDNKEIAKGKITAPPTVEKPETDKDIAPRSWKPAMKEKWAGLDPAIKAEVLRREKEIESTLTKADEDRTFGKQLKEVVTPYMAIIQAEGGTPATAVKDLLNTAYILRTETPERKGELIMLLAKQFNAKLPVESSSTPPLDPNIQALQQEIASMRAERQNERISAQQEEISQLRQQIEVFSADPANEHFDTVKPHMAALMQNNQAKDLQDAYDQAIWAHPEIRPLLLERQQQELAAKRAEENRTRVESARRAGSSLAGGPGTAASSAKAAPEYANLKDELRANWNKLRNQ